MAILSSFQFDTTLHVDQTAMAWVDFSFDLSLWSAFDANGMTRVWKRYDSQLATGAPESEGLARLKP